MPKFVVVIDNATGKRVKRALYPDKQQRGLKRLRILLDVFFEQMSKIDLVRAEAFFKGALQAVYFIMKAKLDPGLAPQYKSYWGSIALYKPLIYASNLLHYANTISKANYDQRTANKSFQGQFIKAFGYSAIKAKTDLER